MGQVLALLRRGAEVNRCASWLQFLRVPATTQTQTFNPQLVGPLVMF